MQVLEIWRYPVKSMQGERLDQAQVGSAGIVGDRSHALRSVETGIVLTARRDPDLLFGRGILDAGTGGACVNVPGHGPTNDADVISAWVGKAVELLGPTGEAQTYETIADPEDDLSDAVAWTGPTWSYHDSTRTQVSIVSADELNGWDVRRFRPNLVVSGPTADVLLGQRIQVGRAQLDVVKQIDRCVMTTRPQPNGIERDLDVLRTIRRERDLLLAVGSLVHQEGAVAMGDQVDVIAPLDRLD